MTDHPPRLSRPRSVIRAFLAKESASGILLIAAALLAIVAANSPAASAYFGMLHAESALELTPKLGPMTPHLWVNDGLMALFFLLVGLEIKRECVDGHLSTAEARRLPVIAAVAGMAAPALLYLAVAGSTPGLSVGWAIPAATDIAFAMAVLALLGPRAPVALKLFLVTVAIVDDMGAVAIIALFYTAKLNLAALAAAAVILGAMALLGRMGVRALWPYLAAFALLWYAVLLSGVHATIAGVMAALMIPVERTPGTPDSATSPLHRLEHALHPWVAYLIIPLFGFANAGVNLAGVGFAEVAEPLPLGILIGLFVGKQLGIFTAVWLAIRFGIAGALRGVTALQLYGVALLCGIGFTMSLFIGGLAFPADPALAEQAKVGILAGSLLSALTGYAVLRLAPLHPDHDAIAAASEAEIDADGDVAAVSERRR
jgi:NhaA family Na+:H+ antiporter